MQTRIHLYIKKMLQYGIKCDSQPILRVNRTKRILIQNLRKTRDMIFIL